MWQICPMCRGTKVNRKFVNGSIIDTHCSICNGMGIISETTGLPPKINTGGYVYEKTNSPYNGTSQMPSVLTGENKVDEVL